MRNQGKTLSWPVPLAEGFELPLKEMRGPFPEKGEWWRRLLRVIMPG